MPNLNPQTESLAWHQVQRRVLFAYEGKVPVSGNQQNFSSPAWAAWLVRHGQVQLRLPPSAAFTVAAGYWVILPPGLLRSQKFSADAEIMSVHFLAHWPDGRPLFANSTPIRQPRQQWQLVEDALRQLIVADPALDPAEFATFCQQQACQYRFFAAWSAAMASAGGQPVAALQLDSRVRQAMLILQQQPGAATVPYAQLQRQCGISRAQLDRLFRAQLQCTPKQHLQQCCLRICSEQLLTTRLPLKQIAAMAGFATQAHFTTWFRRHTGQAPHQFRRCNQA